MTSQLVDLRTPGLSSWLKHLDNDFKPQPSLELYINLLKRRSVRNPAPCAIGTVRLVLRLISFQKNSTLEDLVEYVIELERKLSAACPREMSVRNMVRRVLGIIREEAENTGLGEQFTKAMERVDKFADASDSLSSADSKKSTPIRPASKPPARIPLLSSHTSFHASSAQVTTLFSTLNTNTSRPVTPKSASASTTPSASGTHTPVNHFPTETTSRSNHDLKLAVIEDMQELIEELDNCEKNINELAPQLIHKHEVIMTYGLPTSVHKLLLRAAMKNPDFTIVVVEGNPNVMNHTHGAVMNKVTGDEEEGSNSEQQAARKSLQDRGVKVVVVSDADVWNMISRVNKVFLGANYVLADGAVIAAAGAGGVARMARGMRKPVVVVAGSHMLCPVLCFEKGEMVEMGKPVTVGFNEGDLMANAEFPNPLNDYIEPTKIAMFVTNNGIIPTTMINRHTLDLYHMPEADLI